jgi:hypothetical protein
LLGTRELHVVPALHARKTLADLNSPGMTQHGQRVQHATDAHELPAASDVLDLTVAPFTQIELTCCIETHVRHHPLPVTLRY